MTIGDYESVYELWTRTEGLGLSDADSRESIRSYLKRNPGCSLVACEGGRVVAAVLCGHDGRRGFIYHLAVAASHRRRGIAGNLLDGCLAKLGEVGIQRCQLWVYAANSAAQDFYKSGGWFDRAELKMFSKDIPGPGR